MRSKILYYAKTSFASVLGVAQTEAGAAQAQRRPQSQRHRRTHAVPRAPAMKGSQRHCSVPALLCTDESAGWCRGNLPPDLDDAHLHGGLVHEED